MNKNLLLTAILCAILVAPSSLIAAPLPFTFTGDLTGAPIFNSPVGGDPTHYSAFAFSIDTAGDYMFDTVAMYNPQIVLYDGPFDPANPNNNFFIGARELHLSEVGIGSYFAAGTYVLVNAGAFLEDFGSFSTTISGPAGAQLTPLNAVPEPATMLLLGFGLGLIGVAGMRRK